MPTLPPFSQESPAGLNLNSAVPSVAPPRRRIPPVSIIALVVPFGLKYIAPLLFVICNTSKVWSKLISPANAPSLNINSPIPVGEDNIVNPLLVKNPVLGLKESFVELTFNDKLPVFAVTHVGYIVALVVVSSTI